MGGGVGACLKVPLHWQMKHVEGARWQYLDRTSLPRPLVHESLGSPGRSRGGSGSDSDEDADDSGREDVVYRTKNARGSLWSLSA